MRAGKGTCFMMGHPIRANPCNPWLRNPRPLHTQRRPGVDIADTVDERQTAYVFEDALTAADNKRYIQLPFDVPPGTGALQLDLYVQPLRTPSTRASTTW